MAALIAATGGFLIACPGTGMRDTDSAGADSTTAFSSSSTGTEPSTEAGPSTGMEPSTGGAPTTTDPLPDSTGTTSLCGDGVVEGAEECDDGNAVNEDFCTNACQNIVCGDGIVSPGEGCDDGNTDDEDDCANDCKSTSCGNGVAEPPEVCDDGGQTPTCTQFCKNSVCGDGVHNLAAEEECDEGGETPTCDADCTEVKCGDGHVNAAAGEGCDVIEETAQCDLDCTAATCGDGQVNASAGEACDDGNAVFDDACTPQCLSTPVSLAIGNRHVCATYANKSVHCWGYAAGGQLGYGNNDNLGDNPGELPTGTVSLGGTPLHVSAGYEHTCALLDNHKVTCWGGSGFGQLGQGNTTALGDNPGELPVPPVVIGADALALEAGAAHNCVIVDGGTVRCWGYHLYGQLGYNESGNKLKPDGKNVVGVASAVKIALGDNHSCALLADNTVRCWGYNGEGELGLGHSANVGAQYGGLPVPETELGAQGDPIVQMVAGARHNCILLQSGKVRCWGYNLFGQTGASFEQVNVGDAPGEMPPVDVNLGGPAVQVIAGVAHTCALMASKKVKCWGRAPSHGYPGLGDINSTQEFPPPDVDLGGDVASVSGRGGSASTCAQLADGEVRCWGDNADGQLGLGHTMKVGDNESPGSVGPVPL